MKPKRNPTIDFLRGFAVLLMIVIHVTAYYMSDRVTRIIWDYTHFAVPIFVFCSAYVYFIKEKDNPFNLSYIWKRAIRLVKPYYIFITIMIAFNFFIEKKNIQIASLKKQLFLLGDRDLDWLVILFLSFIVIFPMIRFLEKRKVFLWTFAFVTFLATTLLLFIKVPVHFRTYMWLPWTSIIFMAYFFIKSRYKYEFIFWTVWTALIIFLGSRAYLLNVDKTLVFTENKYPPNIFYLSYGTGLIFLIYALHEKLNIAKTWLQIPFDFLSKYSYEVFFIHFFYLFILLDRVPYKQIGWIGVTALLIILTWATLAAWEKLKTIFSRY